MPEIAWNYGASATQKLHFGGQHLTFNLDYFHTQFQNQVVADLDSDPQKLLFYNLKGRSFSNSIQAELIYEPFKRFEARAAYKRQDVEVTYGGRLLQKPLIARERVLLNLSYATRFDKWKFDATGKWFGINRIPGTQSNPEGLRMPSHSNPYYVFNGQVTRAFKRIEIYAGAENIFNFVQRDQIIAHHDPFGPYFDASLIWGPVMGRVLYAGLRLTVK
jgi:outer membrane receptor protein involved in Fe transport